MSEHRVGCSQTPDSRDGRAAPADASRFGVRGNRRKEPMALLLIARIGSRIHRFPLREGKLTVGSADQCDITLNHPSVSRKHALIQVEGGTVTVSDLGSRNGTRVGRRRITTIPLGPGGTLSLGAVQIRLETVADDDLIPALEFSHAGGNGDGGSGERATTLQSGPAEAFILERLPGLVAAVSRQSTLEERIQHFGQAMFDGFPCHEIAIGPMGEDDGLFTAKRDASPVNEVHLDVPIADLNCRIGFPSKEMLDLYRPLIAALASLLLIRYTPGETPSRPVDPAGPSTPLVLPTPPTVVPSFQKTFEDAAKVARGDLSILITGESGTGKEVVAQFIHEHSPASGGSFLGLNCASLPTDLLESELFGIERGVATGVEARPGKFEAAAGGTLFLDEIGDMPLETQAKILRVLQSKEVYRLGARKPVPLACRIIAATNRDIREMMTLGTFREDLYHRIAGWVFDIPPLRHRRVDIPNLAAHFLTSAANRNGIRVRGVSKAAVDTLIAFNWPGNVRQLEQEMTRSALFLEDGELLDVARLSDEVKEGAGRREVGRLEAVLARVEADEISLALARHETVEAAAETLGISRATLYRRIKALGIVQSVELTAGPPPPQRDSESGD